MMRMMRRMAISLESSFIEVEISSGLAAFVAFKEFNILLNMVLSLGGIT